MIKNYNKESLQKGEIMLSYYLEITAPEELGPVYNEVRFCETTSEVKDYLENYSDGKITEQVNSIWKPAKGSELDELGFTGKYVLYTSTGFIGAENEMGA